MVTKARRNVPASSAGAVLDLGATADARATARTLKILKTRP